MRLKPKTVRRLLLLSLVFVLVLGALGAFVVLRHSRNEARFEARRANGLAALAEGQHVRALEHLGPYLKAHQSDSEILLAYARARRNVEEYQGTHLRDAANIYQRYLGIHPDDADARRELLACYYEAGMYAEVIDTARRLRPADIAAMKPADIEVIRYEVPARQARNDQSNDTVALLRRAIELAPNSFEWRIRLAILLNTAKRSEETAAFVEETAKAFPDDPRVDLLRIAVGAGDTLVQEPLKILAATAGLDPETGERIGPALDTSEIVMDMLIRGFGAMGRTDLLLSALEPRAREGDLNYVRAFSRYALYSGNFARLVETQAAMTDKKHWSAPDVLAVVALSLKELGRRAEADAMWERLEQQPRDYRVISWSMARKVLVDEAPVMLDAIKTLRNATTENPIEPIFRTRLAELLLQLGRAEEARTELTAAERSPLSNGWSRPGVLRVRSFLLENRLIEARKESIELARRFPSDSVASTTLLAVRSEMLDRGFADIGDVRDTAERLSATLDVLSGPQGEAVPSDLRATLIASIAVAADKGESVDLARRAVTLAAESDVVFSTQLLSRLVEISRRRSFDLDNRLIERAERNGPTPASTLVRGLVLHSDAHTQEAIELVRTRAAAADVSSTEWRMLVPCFLDIIKSPDAPEEWKAVLTKYPDDPQIHLMAIQSRSLPRDPALVAQVADRIDQLSGSSGQKTPLIARMARARAMASGSEAAKNRDQIVGMLRSIVGEAPDLLEPRLFLAEALLAPSKTSSAGQTYSEAIEQLRAAIPLASDPAPIRLRIADIYTQSGNVDAARAELNAFAADARADVGARWSAVEALAGIGKFEEAADLAKDLITTAGSKGAPARAVSLARILTLAGRTEDAGRVYADLTKRTTEITPEQAFEIASGLDTIGRGADAKSMLDRLGAMPEHQVDVQRVRARLALAADGFEEARKILLPLTESNPKDSQAWRLLVESYIIEGNLAEARQVFERAHNAVGEDPAMELLGLQLDVRAGEGSTDALKSLADVLEKNPEFQERAAAVRAYATIRENSSTPDPAALGELAVRFPDEPTLQSVIISDLLSVYPPALTVAAEISLQSARRFPAQWQTAADVVRVHRMTAQWNVVLDAAERWRRLHPSPEADFAAAEAQLELNRPRQAKTLIDPYASSLRQDPASTPAAALLWARIAVANGQTEEVRRSFEPMLESSQPVLRGVWLPLATRTLPPDTSLTWLDGAAKAAKKHGFEACVDLADAWITLAGRDAPRREQHLTKAEVLFRDVADGAPEGKLEGLRGLTLVALEKKGDPQVAIAAAERAVEASQSKDAISVLLLGDALLAGAETEKDQAKSQEMAVRAAETYAAAMNITGETPIGLEAMARALEKANRLDGAAAAYERILSFPAGLTPRNRAATQNNLAFVLLTNRPDKTALEKARELSKAAIAVLPVGAAYDTLGAIESMLGNRAAAIEAFRNSLGNRSDSPATMSKLAELLASGSVNEQGEARRLVTAAEKAMEASASNSQPEVAEKIQQVKKMLRMP